MGELRTIAQLLSKQFQADHTESNRQLFHAMDAFQKSGANFSSPHQLQRYSHGFLQSLFTRLAYSAASDWVWPYWMELQKYCYGETQYCDGTLGCANSICRDTAPLPCAGSYISWGKVDPRGLLIPSHNLCSFDTWIVANGAPWFPSRHRDNSRFVQYYDEGLPLLRHRWDCPPNGDYTSSETDLVIECTAETVEFSEHPFLEIHYSVKNISNKNIFTEFCFAIRPFNHRAAVPIFDLVYNSKGFWMNNGNVLCVFPRKPSEARASNYAHGDTAYRLDTPQEYTSTRCDSGLANAVTIFRFDLAPGSEENIKVLLPYTPMSPRRLPMFGDRISVFQPGAATPDQSVAAPRYFPVPHNVETLVRPNLNNLLAFTHPLRFLPEMENGVQDFSIIVKALALHGHTARAFELLELVALRQWKNGFIPLGPNALNSNAQFILAACSYARIVGTHESIMPLYDQLKKAAAWIQKKRHDVSSTPHKNRGILPPSPRPFARDITDYRFADNFESFAALAEMADLANTINNSHDERILRRFAEDYLRNIQDMIAYELEYRTDGILPSYPQRPLDIAAVDNLSCLAPLHIEHKFPNPYWSRNTLNYCREKLSRPFQLGALPPVAYCRLILALLHGNDVSRAQEIFDILASQASQAGLWSTVIDTRTHRGIMGCGSDATVSAWALLAIHELTLFPPASNR